MDSYVAYCLAVRRFAFSLYLYACLEKIPAVGTTNGHPWTGKSMYYRCVGRRGLGVLHLRSRVPYSDVVNEVTVEYVPA